MCFVGEDLCAVEHVADDITRPLVPLFRSVSVCGSVVFDGCEVGVPVVCRAPEFGFERCIDREHALVEVAQVIAGIRVAISWVTVVVWLHAPYLL